MTEPLPCPFCGHVGVTHNEGSTFRWLVTECNGCGAQCGEERIDTLSTDQGAAIEQAAEAAIKTWNTRAAQTEQEPVGWEHHEYRPYGGPGEIRIHAILRSQYMLPDGSVAGDFQWLVDEYKKDKNTIKLIPLYTTPPAAQRPWVGLTDEEILRADPWMGTSDSDINPYQILLKVRTLEAKLKERNT